MIASINAIYIVAKGIYSVITNYKEHSIAFFRKIKTQLSHFSIQHRNAFFLVFHIFDF